MSSRLSRIIVTGGSGDLGRYVVADLLDHGHEVLNLDLVNNPRCETKPIDLRDYGAVANALTSAAAVVHLAANPEPDFDGTTGARRFSHNVVTTYNVLWAAAQHGVPRVVWASSETVFGFPFETCEPAYLPVDDDHPLMPQNSYAIGKVVGEEATRRLSDISETTYVALRYSNVLFTDPKVAASYSHIPDYHGNPEARRFNLWGYVDARDAAAATRLALTAAIAGADQITIAAGDTIMDLSNEELVAAAFPSVPLRRGTGPHETLLSIDRARKRLGWEPRISWRDVVET
jgi:nucleoside-diphosphate-sugar epimerase